MGVGILVFQTGYDILFALQDLEWVSENWDPLKVTRRLPHVGPLGRDVTLRNLEWLNDGSLNVLKMVYTYFNGDLHGSSGKFDGCEYSVFERYVGGRWIQQKRLRQN